MSSTKSVKSAPSVQHVASVEELIESIKALANLEDLLILVGMFEPEISGVDLSEPEAAYREVIPLGDGVHIVLSVNLSTEMPAGIHERA